MDRDTFFAVLMAVFVAAVPNALKICVEVDGTVDDIADKLLLIFALALGPSVVAPFVFGRSLPTGEVKHRIWFPIGLAIAGVAGAAYLIAVVGLGGGDGLGAGLAEMLDSSLAPTFYIIAVVLTGTSPLNRKIVVGLILCFIGLSAVSYAAFFNGGQALKIDGLWLVPFGVLGAIGTAFSLWFLRRLARHHGASLGTCIAFRYGGVAVVFLLLGVAMNVGDGRIPLSGMISAFLVGTIFITAAFYAAVNIDSDVKTAAGMACIPLLAFGLEGTLYAFGVVDSEISFVTPWLWGGIAIAGFGIWILQRDPAVKAA